MDLSKLPRVKISSDGTPGKTKVMVQNEDMTVTEIPYVSGIVWSIDTHGVAKAHIDLVKVAADVVGDEA